MQRMYQGWYSLGLLSSITPKWKRAETTSILDRVVGFKAVVQIGKLYSRERMWRLVMRGKFSSLVNQVLEGVQQGISSLQATANLRQKNDYLQLELSRAHAEERVLNGKFRALLVGCNFVLAAIESTKDENPCKELGEAKKKLREMIADIPISFIEKNSARFVALHNRGLLPESK